MLITFLTRALWCVACTLACLSVHADEKKALNDIQMPPGFQATLFGSPPEVNYPVCLTAAATGEVFVGVDEQGSLGKEPGRGKVLRCVDTNGDGIADQINEFAKMDHPRGLIYDNGSLWVLHPPFLSVFHDTDGDGTADTSDVLIEGISTDQVNKRGADHTTNGIRMGIDGWIYIAVGDFGFVEAVTTEGSQPGRRGGGIVRIRPDGTDMEIYSWGQRNILDVSIDPFMNIFTRDNTNDGGGWDVRVSHILQTADYGYPSLYKHFTHETMPPLADYGGGSGCGSMYFYDGRWPAGFQDLLLTCDWGTSRVYSHRLPRNGATFDPQQDTFLKLPRPTDIDVDASGRMFVSSWKNGKFNYDGPNIGFVAMIMPIDFVPQPVPPAGQLQMDQLLELLRSPSAATQLYGQREILRRGKGDEQLAVLAATVDEPLHVRVAAIYTLTQLKGPDARADLIGLSKDDALREHCLRAMADRSAHLEGIQTRPFLEGLTDVDPRVQAVSLVALGRIMKQAINNDAMNQSAKRKIAIVRERDSVAKAILPLTVRQQDPPPFDGDSWRQADPGRVLPHLAVKALVGMQATDICLQSLNGSYHSGALCALKYLHLSQTVDGLFRVLSTSRDEALQREIWTALIRLYHQEGDYKGGWWGTRPDTTGPYYDRRQWKESERIGDAIKVALSEADQDLSDHIHAEMARHVVKLDGISTESMAIAETDVAIELPKVDPNNPKQLANISYSSVLNEVLTMDGDAEIGQQVFKAQMCSSCHTFANGQQPKGPHLVDIGKRYKKSELIESIVKPSVKIAQGFDTWSFVLESGQVHTGFVVLESAETVTIRQTDGSCKEFPQDDIEERVKQPLSMMPQGIVGNLTTQQLADLIAFLQQLH